MLTQGESTVKKIPIDISTAIPYNILNIITERACFMKYPAILFDLDGTLTDSGEGVINCVLLALRHYGIEISNRDSLRYFVGPPLRESFLKAGVPAESVEEAIAIYRSRYIPIGMFENYPYEGIRELLAQLKERGHQLYVATSKPETMAIAILEKFELAQYFDIICGATMDDSRDSKDKVIGYLLSRIGPQTAVMIGDTAYDVIGAAAHNIPTIGVSWGYGKVEDLANAGAADIVHTPEELLSALAL